MRETWKDLEQVRTDLRMKMLDKELKALYYGDNLVP